jgi:hypothetical protein
VTKTMWMNAFAEIAAWLLAIGIVAAIGKVGLI